MADVVENRVVEMQFDNKDFEKNASTSLSTLEKLKESLQFKNSSKGFQEVQNGIRKLDFSPIQDSISSIDNAFTGLAGSIKRNFFDEIAREAINVGKTLYSNTIGQIQSGGKRRALNIEQAKFKVAGLGADWDAVYEDMDYAVSGTAYGIDEAANAASQFLASSVKTGDDMKAALRGISGIAAMSSSSYSDIANIFTAAAGKGKVQAMELNRISLHGINAAAELAKAMGTTEEAVRDMASKGEIDFNTFAKAMDDAFGEHAKKANETFTGSLSNMKAALSRIGEIFYAPWLESMIPVFNQLRITIDGVKNALKTSVSDKKGGKDTIANELANLMKAASELSVELLKTLGPALDKLSKHFDFIYNRMVKAEKMMKRFTKVLAAWNKVREKPPEEKSTSAASSSIGNVQSEMTGLVMTTENGAFAVSKSVGSAVGAIVDNYKALYNSQKGVLQNTVNLFSKWSHTYDISFSKLFRNLKSNKKGLETLMSDMNKLQMRGVSEDLLNELKNMGTGGADIVHALAKANDKELKEYMDTWKSTNQMFDTISKDWTSGAEETANKTIQALTGLPTATVDSVSKTYDEVFKQMGIYDELLQQMGIDANALRQMGIYDETIKQLGLDTIQTYQGKFDAVYQKYEDDFNAAQDAINDIDSSNMKKSAEDTKDETESLTEFEKAVDKAFKTLIKNDDVATTIDHTMGDLGKAFHILEMAGRKIWKVFEAIFDAWAEVHDAFKMDADGIINLSPIHSLISYIERLVSDFKIGGERAELIKSTFKGFFSILELGKRIVSKFLDAIFPMGETLATSEPFILRVTGAIGEFIYELVQAIIYGDEIPGFFGTLVSIFRELFEAGRKLLSGESELPTFLSDIWDAISGFFSGLTTSGFSLSGWFKKIFNFGSGGDDKTGIFAKFKAWLDGIDVDFDSLFGKIKNVLDFVGGVISDIWGVLKNHLGELDTLLSTVIGWITRLFEESEDKADGMGPILQAAMDVILVALITARDVIWEMKDALGDVLPALLNVVTSIANMFSGIANWVGNDPEGAYGMAAFFALIVLFTKILEYKTKATKKGNIISLLASMTGFFDDLKATVKEFKRTQIFTQLTMLGNTILKIAVALSGLVAAITGGFTKDEGTRKASFKAFCISMIAMMAILGVMIVMINNFAKLMKDAGEDGLDMEPFTNVMDTIGTVLLKIAIGLSIIVGAAGENIGSLIAAAGGVVVILILLGVFTFLIVEMIKELAQDEDVDSDKLEGASEVLTAVAECISLLINSVIKLLAVMMGFIAAGADSDTVLIATAEAVALVGLLLLALAASIALIFKVKIPDPKALWSLIALIVGITIAVKLLVLDLITIAGILQVMPEADMWMAFGLLAAIMGLVTAIIVIISYVVSRCASGSLLTGFLGVAAMFAMIGVMMLSIASAAAMMQAANVSEDTLNGILKIIAIVGLIIIAVGIISGQTGAGVGLMSIAAGVVMLAISMVLVASAIWIVVKALAVLIATFTGLALVWPQISGTVEEMLVQMKALLPIFLELVGDFIVGMCWVIIKSAPMIATAIVTVIVSIFVAFVGWIPGIINESIKMLDEIVTGLLKGAVIILPKLLALILLFLAYLDANAEALGYLLGSVLSKIVWGALKAVLEFLIGTALPNLGKAIVKFFKGDFVDQVTDAMMSDEEVTDTSDNYVTVASNKVWRHQVDGKLVEEPMWYNVNTKQYYKTKEEAMAASEEAEMQESIDYYKNKGNKDLTLEGQNVQYKMPAGLDINLADTAVSGYTDDLVSDTLSDALEEEEEDKSIKDQAKDAFGNIIGGGLEGATESADDSGFGLVTSFMGGAKDAASESGGDIKESVLDKIMPDRDDGKDSADEVLAGYAEEMKYGDLDEDAMEELTKGAEGVEMPVEVDPQYDTEGKFASSLKTMTQFGKGDTQVTQGVQVMPELSTDGTFDYTNMADHWTQGAKVDTDISYSNSNIQQQAEAITALKNQVEELKKAIDSCIIMPKDTNINITTSIDKQKLGTTMAPVLDSINNENARLANNHIAR